MISKISESVKNIIEFSPRKTWDSLSVAQQFIAKIAIIAFTTISISYLVFKKLSKLVTKSVGSSESVTPPSEKTPLQEFENDLFDLCQAGDVLNIFGGKSELFQNLKNKLENNTLTTEENQYIDECEKFRKKYPPVFFSIYNSDAMKIVLKYSKVRWAAIARLREQHQEILAEKQAEAVTEAVKNEQALTAKPPQTQEKPVEQQAAAPTQIQTESSPQYTQTESEKEFIAEMQQFREKRFAIKLFTLGDPINKFNEKEIYTKEELEYIDQCKAYVKKENFVDKMCKAALDKLSHEYSHEKFLNIVKQRIGLESYLENESIMSIGRYTFWSPLKIKLCEEKLNDFRQNAFKLIKDKNSVEAQHSDNDFFMTIMRDELTYKAAKKTLTEDDRNFIKQCRDFKEQYVKHFDRSSYDQQVSTFKGRTLFDLRGIFHIAEID
ncbi:MAG: hypothetical protein H0W88_06665 [Parachlamydiaceae bacterium]|nr:hypothetical protein [Parachlamydiaceae bacterium]